MIVADLRVLPIGSGTSLSQHIKAIHNMLEEEKICHLSGHMSTTLEVDSLDDLFDIIELANQVLAERGVQRILTTVNIDYRLDKQISMESKLSALK
jgi:uncharacterized protein (TIGR00106 family)